MVTLDNFPATPLDKQTKQRLGFPDISLDAEDDSEQDALINQALISAVHAFSARWLPTGYFGKGAETNPQESNAMKEYFVESIWSRAHQDVARVLTRPSYRSILALYLFGTTPFSSKNKDKRISDYCFESALRHYVHLRAKVSIATRFPLTARQQPYDPTDNAPAETKAQEEYIHLQDTAYWFGIVIDGSRALTRCRPSVLLPGFCGEPQVWEPVRKQSEAFDTIYRPMQSSKAILTDEAVFAMIQYGSSCKTLFWKVVSRVQDCLVYRSIELQLETLTESVVQEMSRFERVFGPFLDKCARDHVFLSEKSRISYLILSLHFHLGVLILVDTLEAQSGVQVPSQHIDIGECRLSSTRTVVSIINMMLLPPESYNSDDGANLIFKDPYPEHTRNALTRAAYSVLTLFRTMSVSRHAAEIMASSLFTGLEVLTQVSYTAAESLDGLHRAYSETDLVVRHRRADTSAHLTAPLSSPCGNPVSHEMFEEETVRQLDLAGDDPSLVKKTIERHENHHRPASDDFAWFDLSEIDFTSTMQDWAFEVCEGFP
ncbi:uncharacterized protein Z519_02929 [Cladophialophora bantiana CBS 173.52]|uniref:Transcription factor domain-containing protein n=1 Tax=Cladophialophora bantiana (strain ATCC 10958 / CBS 173.52 / CDC B-1940 / NIH 8579) TaxID=1442370 RepID=A0A0D2HY55_CLAB1|nr:uncharacterized protein Z519_02929 [Cladophialophora bantiana CBS 173.52]KIW95865.1 hypothetical protein Z519_02929 [Cladophialophora bantiana CBS 173.52]